MLQARFSVRFASLLVFVATACASVGPTPAPRAPIRTADGLTFVESSHKGALFIKPDHGITAHHRYHLNQVLMTYERDSKRFSANQEQRIQQYVEDATLSGMIADGSVMVTGAGPCILSMGVGLVDVTLIEPNGSGSTTSLLQHWGAVTLVVDLRDSLSGEPLLRYGRRIQFPGGIQWQGELPPWAEVRTTLDRLLRDQRATLAQRVPASSRVNPRCLPPPATSGDEPHSPEAPSSPAAQEAQSG